MQSRNVYSIHARAIFGVPHDEDPTTFRRSSGNLVFLFLRCQPDITLHARKPGLRPIDELVPQRRRSRHRCRLFAAANRQNNKKHTRIK